MAVSYDDMYQFFLSNAKVSDLDLPSTDEGKYDLIKNGVRLYNNRFRAEIQSNDTTEEIETDLNNDQLLIIGNLMRVVTLKNSLSYKNSIFSTFSKEIGQKFINAQIKQLQEDIRIAKEDIDLIVFYMDDGDLMGSDD